MKSSLAILSLSVAACPLRAAGDDPGLRDRFLKGVAQAATKLEDLSYRAKFEYLGSSKGKDASEEIDKRNYDIAIRGTCLLETGVTKDSGNVFFRVRNDDYGFALERTPEGERASLQFVERIGVNPSVDARIVGMEEVPRAFALGGFYLWTDPLARLVESDSFSVKRVYAVTSGDKELVRVEFEHLVDVPTRKQKYRVTDGFLVCDPAREWALTEYGGTKYNSINKFNSVSTAVLECGETIGGIPIVTKTTRTMNSLDSEYESESVVTTEIISRDVPKEEFYLSHYGLPEPTFQRSWLGTWVWYLIAGIVCLVISAMILKRPRATR